METNKIPMAVLAAALLAPTSHAACPSTTLFSCATTKGKFVEVCDSGKTIDYAFGKKGAKPELALSIPRDAATTNQWAGVGRSVYYSVLIPNGNTVYEVFSSFDRIDHEESAGIYVRIDDKDVATIQCKTDTVKSELEGVELRPVEIL